MAQWLSALANLPEDPGSTPSLQLQFQGTRCPLLASVGTSHRSGADM